MTTVKNLICTDCMHQESFGCKAFPKGIPDEIFLTNKHSKPLSGQKNNLVFKPFT